MFRGSSQLPTTAERAVEQREQNQKLGRAKPEAGSRKLGRATKHLINGSDKRICQLSFEF